ncbi:unnamed protein product [Ixodes hexagonus]
MANDTGSLRSDVHPFLLAATLKHHFEGMQEKYPSATKVALSELGGTTKIPGLGWEPKKDVFRFDVDSLIGILRARKDSKRFVLQTAQEFSIHWVFWRRW